MEKNLKRALVISGGGAWGAYGGGVAEALVKCKKRKYDFIVGTSTGSLLSPLIAVGNFAKLKEAYSTVTMSKIFNVSPFTKKGKPNVLRIIFRILAGKLSFGESCNLRKNIEVFFTEDDFNKVKAENIELLACVVNLSKRETEYKSILDCTYKDFCDWLWISANAPIYMSTVKKDNFYYTDGGVKEHTPAQIAIDNGADEVDIIVHRTKYFSDAKEWNPKNVFDVFLRVITMLTDEVSIDDLKITELSAREKDVKVNVYFLPRSLSKNSLIFNKEEMQKWWEEGFENTKHSISKETFILPCRKD